MNKLHTFIAQGFFLCALICAGVFIGPSKAMLDDKEKSEGSKAIEEPADLVTKQNIAATRATLERLSSTSITLDIQDQTTLRDVLQQLRLGTSIQFVVAEEDVDYDGTFEELQVSTNLRQALSLLETRGEFCWTVSGDLVLVGSMGMQLDTVEYTRAYDVADIFKALVLRHSELISVISDKQVEIRKRREASEEGDVEMEETIDNEAYVVAEDVVRFFEESVIDVLDGGSIRTASSSGLVTIRGTALAHVEAENLIQDIRKQLW